MLVNYTERSINCIIEHKHFEYGPIQDNITNTHWNKT